MINSDGIIYKRPKAEATTGAKANTNKPQELSPGLWQNEALETVGMYGPKEGGFSPVGGKQLTLFPMEETAAVKPLNLDDPPVEIPYWKNFRFLAKDTIRQIQAFKIGKAEGPAAPPSHAKDAVSATNGKLYVPGKTEIKADQFPGRVNYVRGGLYKVPEDAEPPYDAAIVEQQRHAPNYRKMDDAPIHGVGQPTKRGFRDVLNHLDPVMGTDGKPIPGSYAKSKPIVWTNNRAEAVIYINGEPHNLREVALQENLVLKEGATGAEVEALEEQLKQRLIARGSIEIIQEVQNPDGSYSNVPRTVKVNAENTQTTKDVIEELREEGYNIEYKRIPMPDEKSPSPAQVDANREWVNEMQKKHPNADVQYVFNCHQGRGRTTTGMVAAGIALDGRERQLEFDFGPGENARDRADRIIDDAHHLQNLRETVAEYQAKADEQAKRAKEAEALARKTTDPKQKARHEKDAKTARERQARYQTNTTDFTKRYATMQKYSEYIDKFGPNTSDPSFEEWMAETPQVEDLGKRWTALNEQFGLTTEPMQAVA